MKYIPALRNMSKLDKQIIEEVLKGDNNPAATKIFRVSTVTDNNLWEPYYDTDREICVRINKNHRFARLIFEENSSNINLQILFELMLLQLADAEVYFLSNYTSKKLSFEELESLMTEYRRVSSEYLADMCRKLEDKLRNME